MLRQQTLRLCDGRTEEFEADESVLAERVEPTRVPVERSVHAASLHNDARLRRLVTATSRSTC
jgi:hypothetical protein